MADDDFIRFPAKPELDAKTKRAQSLVGSSAGRPKDDFYRTPDNAVHALLDAEPFTGKVWEPACGDGAICKVLEQRGFDVVATDLVDRGYGSPGENFLLSTRRCDNIITNPPYNLGEEFVHHALTQTTGKVAMLMKLAFLEGAKRKQMYKSTPIKRVLVFSKRLTMARNGEDEKYSSGMIAFAWFVWEHGYRGEPTLDWL